MKNIDIYVKPIKKILTILCFRGPKRPHSCAIASIRAYLQAHNIDPGYFLLSGGPGASALKAHRLYLCFVQAD